MTPMWDLRNTTGDSGYSSRHPHSCLRVPVKVQLCKSTEAVKFRTLGTSVSLQANFRDFT
jgi:hypothetical protein